MITATQLPLLKAHFTELLSLSGFRPTRTDDDDIKFRVEGMQHVLDFYDKDPAYVRVLVPGFFDIESADELQRAYIAASDTCKTVKGAKVFVYDEHLVSLTVEYLVTSLEMVDDGLISRHLSMTSSGMQHFRKKMEELEELAGVAAKAGLVH